MLASLAFALALLLSLPSFAAAEYHFVSAFGAKGSGNGQLSGPGGAAIDSKGNIWVADTANHRVEEFNSKGEYVSQFSGTGEDHLDNPTGLAFDASGNL